MKKNSLALLNNTHRMHCVNEIYNIAHTGK